MATFGLKLQLFQKITTQENANASTGHCDSSAVQVRLRFANTELSFLQKKIIQLVKMISFKFPGKTGIFHGVKGGQSVTVSLPGIGKQALTKYLGRNTKKPDTMHSSIQEPRQVSK